MKTLKPHRRVMLLAVALMTLMTVSVGIGTLGIVSMKRSLDTHAKVESPRLTNLLHLDRDLFRAQRSVEDTFLTPIQTDRSELLAEYKSQVERTRVWWDSYLSVSAGLPEELQWQSDYVSRRDAWLKGTERLADFALAGKTIDDPQVASQIATTQANFTRMRTTVDKLEENLAEPQLALSESNASSTANRVLMAMMVLMVVGTLAGAGASVATYRSARHQHRESEHRNIERIADADRAAFEAELTQALDMAQTEADGFRSMKLVLREIVTDGPTELLLADSSHAHLKQILSTDDEVYRPGCPALVPGDCPAIRRGTTLTFTDGAAFSACPNLRDRGGEPCSAVCVPVSVAGRTVGVLHTTRENGVAPDQVMVGRLTEVADRSGDRIGVLRAFAKSQAQASTDPLTGMLNRRSFEDEVSARLRNGASLAVAYCDLDHFKDLNDTYGHDAGDRALRLFSKVVRDSLRDNDLAGRWGGEEFVIMFDDADSSTAAAALDRMRQHLAVTVAGGSTPAFTASFGLADTSMTVDLEELVNMADEALLHAKKTGRNKTVVSGLFDRTESDTDDAVAADKAEAQVES